MYEGRFLYGNVELWHCLVEAIFQEGFWATPDFFQAKMAEKKDRYARYHNTSYNLEPDLKHSPGGLRDLHLVLWIMLRHYGTRSFDATKVCFFLKNIKNLNKPKTCFSECDLHCTLNSNATTIAYALIANYN